MSIGRERSLEQGLVVRLVGIQLARGDYLAFLDDDDIFLPGHLGTALAALSTGMPTWLPRCASSRKRASTHEPAGIQQHPYDVLVQSGPAVGGQLHAGPYRSASAPTGVGPVRP
ncbi:glycosyltransferase [Micromonospora sp. bgisy143]|uniref:glycosyltransferase n=1 Tax=Micromonospora sp. bgisy143 TaxID=3413790 RepID=UPI003EBCDBA6